YYTPSGTSIHGVGIEPDIPIRGEIIEESERKEVNRLFALKILEEYTKSAPPYNEETKKKFYELLRSKNISISERSAHYLLKKELMRFTRPPIYDLEFDPQLMRAISVINERR
ncbi:MAG: hypothetical protein N2316_08510, partial [Spirochaetes bacterium]|nr:hypothetical protein [Spirochaetota bacterium]